MKTFMTFYGKSITAITEIGQNYPMSQEMFNERELRNALDFGGKIQVFLIRSKQL